jgi:hypothetical protein
VEKAVRGEVQALVDRVAAAGFLDDEPWRRDVPFVLGCVAAGFDTSLGDEHVLPEVRVRPRDGDAFGERGELGEPAQARRRYVRVLETRDGRDVDRRTVEKRASAPLRPPSVTERRRRDDADLDLAVALERDERRPDR